MTLVELHLFAGIGGGILGGALLGHRCVAAVELDPYCRRVLEARQRDGCLEPFPIFRDVRSFDGRAWRGVVDVVCGGFPCQPWSSAGKRLGTADPRHLWPEMARIVDEVRPAYVFAENVNLKAFAEPWRDLRGMGYRVPPALCLAAADCGAPHLRKRWWMLARDADGEQQGAERDPCGRSAADASGVGQADPNADGRRRESQRLAQPAGLEGAQRGFADGLREAREQHDAALAVTGGAGLAQRQGPQGQRPHAAAAGARWWATEPRVGRVAHGVPSRMDRLRCLGNGVVPQCAELIGLRIRQLDEVAR